MSQIASIDHRPGTAPGEHDRSAPSNPVVRGVYYPYIDGLRCLAVLPVVLYHLLMTLCPAGFMGVDIFFVISGYLICGGIRRDLQAGTFSIASFYHRRIRRIFPAYFALVIGVLTIGTVLYHWARVVPLAQTALFSALFSTNIYFWLDMGYFQPNAHANPLLNLWSLGVEEQFYIFVPFLSLVFWRIRRPALVYAYAIGLLLSLSLCLFLGHRGDSTTAFYLLPTRAWELLAGGILAAAPQIADSLRNRLLAVLGLLLVSVSFWCFSTRNTFSNGGTSVECILPHLGSLGVLPFPGIATIPVILGSLLLLRYGSLGAVSRLLCFRPCVAIGKISYSLYLWHWPVITFLRYINFERLPPLTVLLAVVLSFVLAYLSWRYVEQPIRLSNGFTQRMAFSSTLLGSTLLLAVCLTLIWSDGLRFVLHPRATVFASPPRAFLPNFKKLLPAPVVRSLDDPASGLIERLGAANVKPTFIILGDSHAEALAPGLGAVASEYHAAGYYLNFALHPFTDGHSPSPFDWVAANPDIRDVYLVGRWLQEYRVESGLPRLGEEGPVTPVTLAPATARIIEQDFRRTATWLKERGKTVYVFTSVPDYDYAPADIMARNQILPWKYSIKVSAQDYFNRQRPISEILTRLRDEGLIRVIPLGEALISEDRTVFMGPTGEPYYRDFDHLTLSGAKHVSEIIAPLLWPKP